MFMRDAGFVEKTTVDQFPLPHFAIVNPIQDLIEFAQIDPLDHLRMPGLLIKPIHFANAKHVLDVVFDRVDPDFKDTTEFLRMI